MQLSVEREWTWDWNAFGALMLGIGQAIGGALAMVFSAGVYGMGLISEGISDIVSGIISVVKGDGSFSWAEYFTSKALSLAVSLVCFCISNAKAVWKAGKALYQRSVTFAKSMWKNGLRATLKTTKQAIVQQVKRVAVVVSRDAFKRGLVKCGTELGSHVVKQVLITGVNFATDAGIREAFNALEAKIDDLVKEKVGTWADGDYGRKMERLHHMFLMDKRHTSALRVILDKSKYTLGQRQQAGDAMLEQFGRMLADAMAGNIAQGLEKNKRCALAVCVKLLTEGLKWTEVCVQVAQFLNLWLDIVAHAIDDELAHLTCVDVTAAAPAIEQWNALEDNGDVTLALHKADDRVHWQPADQAMVETLSVSTALDKHVPGMRHHVSDAATKLRIDSEFTAQGVAWASLRGMLVKDASSVATAFIRGKFERRTAELSKRLAAYGTRKLVDSTVDAHLKRKAGKLMETPKSSNAEEAAAHEARVDRFLQDNVVAKKLATVIGDVRGDGPASLAVLGALARQDDVPIVIRHENGDETVLNASGSGPPMHFDESGTGKLRHLVPRETGNEHEPFEDTAAKGDKSCLYRAYFFHKLGRNGTDAEIERARDVIAERFASDQRAQLDLYNQRKPKHVYGANKGRNSIKQEAAAARQARAEAAPANDDSDLAARAYAHKKKHVIVSSANSFFRVAPKSDSMKGELNVQKHIGNMIQFVASREGKSLPRDEHKRILDFEFTVGFDANAGKYTQRVHFDGSHGHPNVHQPKSMRAKDIPMFTRSEFTSYMRDSANRAAYVDYIGELNGETDLHNPGSMDRALKMFDDYVKKHK